jgi:hypothetical protein
MGRMTHPGTHEACTFDVRSRSPELIGEIHKNHGVERIVESHSPAIEASEKWVSDEGVL